MRNTCYHLIDVGKAFDKIQYPVLFKNKNKVKNNSHTRNSRELLKSDKGQIFFFSIFNIKQCEKLSYFLFTLGRKECLFSFIFNIVQGVPDRKRNKGIKN